MKRVLIVFIGLLGSTIICAHVWAQATAQISGTVRDQSGAVLPGVEVTVMHTDTGIRRSSITNETGSYVLPNLTVGPYRLEAALPGFRTFVQSGIVLQVNSNPVINPLLEVGQITEAIEVRANAALVETRTTSVGQVIENERILELPLNGRQVTDLITLSGAAVQTGVSPTRSFQGGVFLSVAGGQQWGVSYSLDGAMHNNVYDGSQMPMPFPDALQEFSVESSGRSAAGGTRGSGGQVSAVTKSGTNEFHGNAFEFVRNYKFNSRNYFASARDTLKRNQYGGTLGGPILRNRLFFFGGYQGTKTRSDPSQSISYVPTPAMMAGDFTTFASPACNAGRQIALRAPFANNRIDPALYSKAAINIASKLPKAQDECGKITYGSIIQLDEWQTVGKVDYQWSDKHSIFGRYMATTFDQVHPYALSGGNILTTTSDGFDSLAQSYAFGSTYLASPNTVNAFRLTVNRTASDRTGSTFFGPTDVGINGHTNVPGNLILTVTGGPAIGQSSGPGTFRTTSYQIGDDVNLIRGAHQMTFGANAAHWRTNQYAHRASLGAYAFNGTATGLGMADFLTGRLTTLNQGGPTMWATRQTYLGVYASDVWKMTPKLTLNYGLRWEPFLPLRLTMGALYSFDYDRFRQGIRSTVYPNAPAGLHYPGDPGFPKDSPIFPKWLQFGPSLGLAWDPWGDGRTSIRAAFGITSDFSGSDTWSGSASAPPWTFDTTVNSPAGGLDDPWRDYPGGMPFPWVFDSSRARFPVFSTYYPTAKYHMKPLNVQSWNLSIQKQIPADVLVSATYLGSQTTHIWYDTQINAAVYFPGGPCTIYGVAYPTCSTTGNTNQRRRLFLENPQEGQYFAKLANRDVGGTQSYHGLLLSVQRRAASGVNIGGNYTWSHCLGDAWIRGQTGGGGPLDPNDRTFDRGNCPSDRRHIFNMTAVAGTPQFANPTLRMLASGWRLSGIYRRSTGGYLTLSSGLDRLLSGFADNQRPVQVLGNPYGDRESLNYLNPDAFAQPALGTIGNMRPRNIEGPGASQVDIALSRVFQVREDQRLEFRAEAFNVTNSLIRLDPSTNLNQNTFGQINSSRDARILQFAFKYAF